MQVESPQLGFPNTFCCNCGTTDCKTEDQDTRVTRFFSIGRTERNAHVTAHVAEVASKHRKFRPYR